MKAVRRVVAATAGTRDSLNLDEHDVKVRMIVYSHETRACPKDDAPRLTMLLATLTFLKLDPFAIIHPPTHAHPPTHSFESRPKQKLNR